MLNFLSTLGAQSQFQKNRLILTKPNYDTPNQQAMKNILHTFVGEDEQTRSQIAYACVIKKIHCSNSKDNWLYLLKNLIILDRVMSENRFCQELVQTMLHTIQNYVDPDYKCAAINTKILLKGYWNLIKDVCRLKISRKHMLFYKRSQRKSYLQSLYTHEIFTQIQDLQNIFDNCISMIFLTSGIMNKKQQRPIQIVAQKWKKYYQQFISSSLAEYLNIHFYSKLLTFFSCQYLCIHKFIQTILLTARTDQKILIQDAKQFKKMVYKFKNNCQNMILIAQKNKGKKGFENIDTKQFSTFSQEHIIKAIDQYILQNSNTSQYLRYTSVEPLLPTQNQHLRLKSQKFVDRKPLVYNQNYGVSQKSPRKFIECRKQFEQYGVFQSYFNSYSDQFPHKNMMTIDLIEDIKRDQEKQYLQILDNAQGYADLYGKYTPKQHEGQINFFKQFKKQKSKLKIRDILIFDKDFQKQQQKQDSTNYSFKNSSREGSLFDVLNIKWLPHHQQGEA